MTQKEKEMLAVVVERLENVKQDTEEIKQHQQYQNGKISDTMIKLAKTDEIAKESKASAVDCRKYVDKLVIAVIGASATAVISLIVAIVTIISERPNV